MSAERTRLCDRCLRELLEGRGQFFEVRVAIVADPTPPVLDDAPGRDEVDSEYRRLIAELEQTSAREAAEQVWRHRVWTLCNHCLEIWLDHPFGKT